MKKLFFYITLFALSNLYSYSNETSGLKAQAKAPQTTFQFAVQKKAFFFEKKDYKFQIKKVFLAKGDKGVLTTIEDGYGLAIYTNAKGTETIGWLNLCDLTVSFSFAQNPTLQFSTVEKKDTFFFNNEHTNFIAFDLLFTYPSYYENGNLAKLQQQFIENAFGEDYKTVTPENVLQKYVANTVSAYTDEAMDEIAYNFTRHNKLLWLEGNLLHCEDNSWEYTGGAHGNGDTEHRIIDLSAYTNSNLDF
ncbi:hypothetical protein AGMMS4957_21880 [Bacteroidia bacterium]|nr:hypothetical protein AGMMS4957_21880 [Bacteroidia bacterium]